MSSNSITPRTRVLKFIKGEQVDRPPVFSGMGNIIKPDTAKEKPQEGKIIALGTDDDFVVKKGDKVIYAKYSGTEIKLDGKDHLLMREEDILGIVK